jgi:hypothetical protein
MVLCPSSSWTTLREAPRITSIEAKLWRLCGAPHNRHAFAVLKLLSWYERGVDVNAKLPLLATYIGHVGISSLQVYLHMTRDLVGEVVKLQRRRFGDLITAEARP